MLFLKAFSPFYFKSLIDKLAGDREARQSIPGVAAMYAMGMVLFYFSLLFTLVSLMGCKEGWIYAGVVSFFGYILILIPCAIALSAVRSQK